MMLLVTRAIKARGSWDLPPMHGLERFSPLRQSQFCSASLLASERALDINAPIHTLIALIIMLKSPQFQGALLCLV
jgi:hypothetical protein